MEIQPSSAFRYAEGTFSHKWEKGADRDHGRHQFLGQVVSGSSGKIGRRTFLKVTSS